MKDYSYPPWYPVSTPYTAGTAAVIGAGIAGASIAYALAQRGWKINLYERNNVPGSAASANPAALVRPIYRNNNEKQRLIDEHAWKSTASLFHSLSLHKEGHFDGVLDINPKSITPYSAKVSHKTLHLDNQIHHGLWLEKSGWINPRALCSALIEHPAITASPYTRVDSINPVSSKKADQQWLINLTHSASTHSASTQSLADIVIVATGHQLRSLAQTRALDSITMNTELAVINTRGTDCNPLPFPICGDGYAIPINSHTTLIGGASQQAQQQPKLENKHQLQLLEKGRRLGVTNTHGMAMRRAALRASSPDRQAMVGPAPIHQQYLRAFQDLHHGKPLSYYHKALDNQSLYHAGLYIFGNLGGHGITQAPWLAEQLCQWIEQGNNQTIAHLHPARHWIQRLKKQQQK